jgi:hypothetical protein
MNIVQEILREHSRTMRDKIVGYVGRSPSRFAELVKVFMAGPYRVTQRAAWPLSFCVEQHPALIKPHLKALIQNLGKPGQHASVKRNTIRLLQFIDIPKALRGAAANVCFKFLADTREPIAVRVFCMTVLANLSKAEPGLKQEVRLLIEDQLPSASAAMRSRANKILKELKD